jgi:hypothetical protein
MMPPSRPVDIHNSLVTFFVLVGLAIAFTLGVLLAPIAKAQETTSIPKSALEEPTTPVKAISLTFYYPNGDSDNIKPLHSEVAPNSPCVAFVTKEGNHGVFCGTYKMIANK